MKQLAAAKAETAPPLLRKSYQFALSNRWWSLLSTGVQVAVVVGGMAPQKQSRMLRRCPEIVVATPGRLWDLIEEGDPHLQGVRNLRYLAIDETDRMLEKGHFEELHKLLEMINSNKPHNCKKRQNKK